MGVVMPSALPLRRRPFERLPQACGYSDLAASAVDTTGSRPAASARKLPLDTRELALGVLGDPAEQVEVQTGADTASDDGHSPAEASQR